jgi:hypothetical protein
MSAATASPPPPVPVASTAVVQIQPESAKQRGSRGDDGKRTAPLKKRNPRPVDSTGKSALDVY